MEQTHILLTGASRGSGAAIAERLGNEEGVLLELNFGKPAKV